jgi:hypothetical protein
MKKRKRATTIPKTIIQTRRRGRRIQEITEAIQGTTKQPKEIELYITAPWENVQEVNSPRNDQIASNITIFEELGEIA